MIKKNVLAYDTYHITEAVQAMGDIHCGWLYYGSWCANMLCIASLHGWFKTHTDEHAMKSN